MIEFLCILGAITLAIILFIDICKPKKEDDE